MNGSQSNCRKFHNKSSWSTDEKWIFIKLVFGYLTRNYDILRISNSFLELFHPCVPVLAEFERLKSFYHREITNQGHWESLNQFQLRWLNNQGIDTELLNSITIFLIIQIETRLSGLLLHKIARLRRNKVLIWNWCHHSFPWWFRFSARRSINHGARLR